MCECVLPVIVGREGRGGDELFAAYLTIGFGTVSVACGFMFSHQV